MEKEISLGMQLGVVLIVISAVLFIVVYTVYLGNEVKADAFEVGHRMLIEVDEGYLSDMVGQDNHIPMATAYNLMRTYSRRIGNVSCQICGKNNQNMVYEKPCLINHRGGLSGKVYLEVSKPYESEYHIVIKPGD